MATCVIEATACQSGSLLIT